MRESSGGRSECGSVLPANAGIQCALIVLDPPGFWLTLRLAGMTTIELIQLPGIPAYLRHSRGSGNPERRCSKPTTGFRLALHLAGMTTTYRTRERRYSLIFLNA